MTLSPTLSQGRGSPPLVAISHLSKGYRRGGQFVPVLRDITLAIPAGDFIALMGPSGSGKSTLLNLIAGIDKPDSGELRVGGEDITRLSEAELADWRAANVGFIFQFYNLMPVLDAFENVELPLRRATKPTSVDRHFYSHTQEGSLTCSILRPALPFARDVQNNRATASSLPLRPDCFFVFPPARGGRGSDSSAE